MTKTFLMKHGYSLDIWENVPGSFVCCARCPEGHLDIPSSMFVPSFDFSEACQELLRIKPNYELSSGLFVKDVIL